MHFVPLLILLAWIPFGIYLFHRLPGRKAILVNFLGGWAVLPGAWYTPSDNNFPYWIEGDCLPTTYFFTKATVTAIAALAGFAFFFSPYWKTFRPALIDLPMALWCVAPLLSALRHPDTLTLALFGALYQTLAWGVPWILGRICFCTHDSLLLAVKACIVAGLCYVPICLVEFFTGPQLYALLYGYEPYRWVGADRYLGFRPIGLLEDGNQLGIWMAAAALLAVSLRANRLATHLFRIPMGWIALGLVATTLLCQSAGSILLLLLLLPLTLSHGRKILLAYGAVSLLGILAFTLFLMGNHAWLRAFAEHNPLLRSLASGLGRAGRHSAVWRIARDDSHMAIALQTPFLGSGLWNWWQNGDARPWSLWMLVFGMYGAVGLAAFGSILFLPVVRAIGRFNSRSGHRNLRIGVVAVILMVAFDNLLNGAMILPYLLLFAGLASIPMNQFEDRKGIRPGNQPANQSANRLRPAPVRRSNPALHQSR